PETRTPQAPHKALAPPPPPPPPPHPHSQPAAGCPPHPRAPPPRPATHPPAAAAPPRSRQARSGTRAASPARPLAPQTPAPHPPATGPGLRSGTSANPAPHQPPHHAGRPQTAPPSAPNAADSPAPTQRRKYIAPQQHPMEQAQDTLPKRKLDNWEADAQSGRAPTADHHRHSDAP